MFNRQQRTRIEQHALRQWQVGQRLQACGEVTAHGQVEFYKVRDFDLETANAFDVAFMGLLVHAEAVYA